jgi:hypothetical protein
MTAPARVRRTALALLVSAVLVPALAGCGGNPIENLIEGATGGNVQLGGNSVPDGFPSEVPLYDGEVLYGVAVGDDAGKAFNVTVRVPDAAAGEQIRSDLEGAGFTLIGGTAADAAGGAAYDGTNWGVVVVLIQDDKGWVANYTVTPKDSSSSQ